MRTVAAACRELTADRRTDGELLATFLAERSESSFLELVRRHGPLVWGACRRLLPDPADAEDAFQAAFLVLVRRARRLTGSDAVGPWLHRAAVWTARNIRRKNARRLARQQPLAEHVSARAPETDLKADIDAALLALPARYRDSIVLCHLQGFTRREAAARLGCAEGTLSAWLHRGLAKLRVRLDALDPTKLGVAVAVPAALAASTARAAVAASVAATLPPAVASVVEGVLHMLWMKKATAATFAVCAVFALGVGTGLGTRPGSVAVTAQEKGVPGPAPKAESPSDKAKEIAASEAEFEYLQRYHTRLQAVLRSKKDEIAAEQRRVEEIAAQLKTAQDRLAKLKGTPADIAKEIAALEKLLGEKEADYKFRVVGVEAARAKYEATKTKGNPKDIQEDAATLARFQREADKVAAEVNDIKAKLAKLKAAPPGSTPKAEPSADRKEAAALEKQVQAKETQLEAFRAAAVDARKQVERIEALLKKPGFGKLTDLDQAERKLRAIQEVVRDAEAELKALKDSLAKLKGAAPPAAPAPKKELPQKDRDQLDAFRAQMEAKIELWAAERVHEAALESVFSAKVGLKIAENRKAEPKVLQEKRDELAEAQKEVEVAAAQLKAAKDKLAAANAVLMKSAYLVLTVAGKADDAQFVLREVPVEGTLGGKPRGPVVTRDEKMLATLLARAKADPAGPLTVRVVVEPQMTMDRGTRDALRACDAAGYTTVTFTGYVALRRFAGELPPTAQGNVPDYVRYDARGKKPAELLQEIEKGLTKE